MFSYSISSYRENISHVRIFVYVDVVRYTFCIMNMLSRNCLPFRSTTVSFPVFSCVPVAQSIVFCVVLCMPFFVLLYVFLWPLYCLYFFELQLLVTPLVSSSGRGEVDMRRSIYCDKTFYMYVSNLFCYAQ
jgi:hypothetical protein